MTAGIRRFAGSSSSSIVASRIRQSQTIMSSSSGDGGNILENRSPEEAGGQERHVSHNYYTCLPFSDIIMQDGRDLLVMSKNIILI